MDKAMELAKEKSEELAKELEPDIKLN